MIFFAVAFALLLHVAYWGAGLAMLAMPARWRRFWAVLVFPAGFALQSLVVWLGAYANLHGTNQYAWWAEIIPAVLVVYAARRSGARAVRDDLSRFGLVWLIVAGVLTLLMLPFPFASRGLGTISLGSCDAADYAAGARVFMEYAHSDRHGFLGLTEVVRVMSADNFFDFWLRLNHFTPSALIALNGSVLHCAPHELTGVLTAVVLAASVPVVFWMARALFGYSGAASLVIAALYGISPITWYSVAQVSPAPLLAAQALALLGWAGVALWNGRLTGRRARQFWGVLGIGYAIVLGSYNFILLVGLVPPVAYAGLRAWQGGRWGRLAVWVGAMVAPLLGCGVVFWARVAGLVERFMLFQTYDFGWKIPPLGPEGWLGVVRGGSLEPWWLPVRWVLAAVFLTVLGWSVVRSLAAGKRRTWVVISTTVPVLAGYAFLEFRGVVRGTNASYDAFKLFAVFYPLLLPAFCWWITLRWSSRIFQWLGVVGFASVVMGCNLVACAMGIFYLARAPLRVDGELRQLRRIERMPEVQSVNLLIPDMWSRLWANAFLLERPQYFLTHTYEGRLNTPLRGDWDLVAGVLDVRMPDSAYRPLTANYRLLDTRNPFFVRTTTGEGWHADETLPNGERWAWTRGDATVKLHNPHAHPVTTDLTLDGRAYEPRDLVVGIDGQAMNTVHVGTERRSVSLGRVTIPPGESALALRSAQPPSRTSGDDRSLGVCVYRLRFVPVAAQ